ncbi:hypothetical protein BX070DRAFT_181316, partial [Coemansia spiralis]
LQLSSYINQKQADMRLEKNLHAEPGGNIVLIMGDWSVPMTYFHEPIKRIGIWWVLRNQGVKIHLIDEYECKDELEAYYYVDDPRTWRRK